MVKQSGISVDSNTKSDRDNNDPGSLRFYWMTGCSSCQRAKEFLLRNNIPFESINLSETPDRMEELRARGFRGVPVLLDDQHAIIAQDLNDVATFVGLTLNHQMLPPDQLAERMDSILVSAIASAGTVPTSRLRESLAGRDRSHSYLIHHIFRVAEAFIEQAEEQQDRGSLSVFPDALATTEELVNYGKKVQAEFSAWWEQSKQGDRNRLIKTFEGHKPLHRVLERATWHSAHHTRQLEKLVLTALGVSAPRPLGTETLKGLPMPTTLF